MPAETLKIAAGLASERLTFLTIAQTVGTDLTNFINACNASGLFDNNRTNDRPMINWISVISPIAKDFLAHQTDTPPDYQLLNASVMYLYQMLYLASYLSLQTPANGGITSAQATAVLAAFNAFID